MRYIRSCTALQNRLYRTASLYEDTEPEYLSPSFRFTVNHTFYPITKDNAFTKHHYSSYFISLLESTKTESKIVQTINVLIYWLDTIRMQVNDLCTVSTDNTPSNHYSRTLVNIIRTFEYQIHYLTVNLTDVFEPCLTLQQAKHNERGEPKLNEHLEKRFDLIYQMIEIRKKEFKTPTLSQLANTINIITSMQINISKCTTISKKLKRTLKNYK